MFNQNFQDARFNFNQVEKLLAHLRSERSADAKPVLMVLHERRVRGGPAKAPNAIKLIRSWEANSACCTHACPLGKCCRF
jgi:proteinaceous RNase P